MNRFAALRRALPVVCLALVVAAPLGAVVKPMDEDGETTFTAEGRTLYWQPHTEYGRLVVTVSGPGVSITREFEAGEEVKLELDGEKTKRLEDGYYKWQLQVVPEITPEVRHKMQVVREALDQQAVDAAQLDWLPKPRPAETGGFSVLDGAVVSAAEREPVPEPRAPEPLQVPGDLEIAGDLTVRGAKHFSMRDPEDPQRTIVYAALEGPEVGTYYRGTARTVGGRAVIELPKHFAKTTEPAGLTVQLTPLGGWSNLYVAEKSPQRLVVVNADEGEGVEFDFLIQGVRRGFNGFDPETRGNHGSSEVSHENR